MNIYYQVEALKGLFEADLPTVEFETLETCPVCHSPDLEDVSVLENSLVTSWCVRCCHLFHRKRPTLAWCHQWYQSQWDHETALAKDLSSYAGLLRATVFLGPLQKPLIYNVFRTYLKLVGRQSSASYLKSFKSGRTELYEFCKDVLPKNAAVLDIGCGYGFDLLPFVRAGHQAYGIEASEHRSATAGLSGVTTSNIPVEALTPETFSTKFDLIFSNHVLEHVANPAEFLEAVRRVLKPGGWLCIGVPNVENDIYIQNFFFALHLHCFSKKSLNTLLKQHHLFANRTKEDFEIRMLAQYLPEVAPETGLANEWLSYSEKNPPPAEFILKNTLGPKYEDYQGKTVYWKMRDAQCRVRAPYDVVVEETREPERGKMMTLKWEGEPALPMRFIATNHQHGSPFWVK